jgi:hypothetical protein
LSPICISFNGDSHSVFEAEEVGLLWIVLMPHCWFCGGASQENGFMSFPLLSAPPQRRLNRAGSFSIGLVSKIKSLVFVMQP